ncbi:MAG: leucine-rich repeat domain-containing protein [Prevotella sp.]|nr:leucine-rich repeat domain-containing protein [Prevotella sp.]
MKRILFLYVCLMTAMLSFAHDFEVGGIYYWITSSSAPYTVAVTYKGTSYSEYSNEYTGSVTIPEKVTYNGKTYSVTYIGWSAFRECSGLTSITIPNSVTSISSDAFDGTAWYDNQPNGLVYAGKVAYKYKGAMPENTAIVLEEGTTEIADEAFYNCSGLTSITIPNSVTSIGMEAFSGCTGLTSIEIPNSVTRIGGEAFSGCTGLASVTIPNSVIYLGGTFRGCSGLTSVNIPNSVTVIDLRTFEDCSSLTSITIPSSVTIIGQFAFSGCSSLTSITIPNSVTSIGDGAFKDCSGLTSITIPNSVTSIGNYAFNGCSGMKEIISYINKPIYIYSNCWRGVDKSIPLYVPAGTKEKYQSTDGWKEFTNIIEFGGDAIEPTEEGMEVDMTLLPDQMDLNGMVVGDTYYVLDADNGDGADSENGCVVIITTTTDGAIDGIAGKDVSDASVKAAFKGIIFMVPAGTGTISINAETLGTSSLKVKIGSQAAQAFQLAERATVQIPYNVAEPTYVYIYAGTGIQAARSVGAARAAAAENSVKVYSYKWEPADPTGINSVDNSQSATGNEAGDWYTIDGRKLSGKPAQKGIYIVNGRKVAVK